MFYFDKEKFLNAINNFISHIRNIFNSFMAGIKKISPVVKKEYNKFCYNKKIIKRNQLFIKLKKSGNHKYRHCKI